MGLNIECWTLPFHFQSFHSSIIRFNLNVGSWPRQLVSFIFVIFNKAPYPTQLDIFWSCMSIHSYSSIGIDLWFMYSVHYFVFDALPALATVPCLISLSVGPIISDPASKFLFCQMNDSATPLNMSACSSTRVSLCSETFVRAPQCFAVSLCIYTRACCVMRPSPVFCHLRNYTAGQCEPSVVSTADSVYPTKQQLVRQESM